MVLIFFLLKKDYKKALFKFDKFKVLCLFRMSFFHKGNLSRLELYLTMKIILRDLMYKFQKLSFLRLPGIPFKILIIKYF